MPAEQPKFGAIDAIFNRNLRATSLTTADASTPTAEDSTAIDATYDAVEQAVLENARTRIGELETIILNLRTRLNELETHLQNMRVIG
jgi:hypothetical protein